MPVNILPSMSWLWNRQTQAYNHSIAKAVLRMPLCLHLRSAKLCTSHFCEKIRFPSQNSLIPMVDKCYSSGTWWIRNAHNRHSTTPPTQFIKGRFQECEVFCCMDLRSKYHGDLKGRQCKWDPRTKGH